MADIKKIPIYDVVLTGIPTVGKTTIYNKTKEIALTSRTIEETEKWTINYQNIFKLRFKDTRGEERYNSLTRSYFEGCTVILLIFALNNRNSFDEMRLIDYNINDHIKQENVIKILVGNKSDLNSEISLSDCLNLKSNLNCEEFIMTSALMGFEIETMINKIEEHIIRSRYLNHELPIQTPERHLRTQNTGRVCCLCKYCIMI